MKPCSTHFLPRLSVLLVAVAATGCISEGTHNLVVTERDQFAKDKVRLEKQLEKAQVSNASLQSERVELIDAMEDLRQEHATLSSDVARLRKAEAELSENLAAREAELYEKRERLAEISETYAGLVEDLESEVASGQIQIEQLREGLRLNLSEEILFASGSAQLNSQGNQVLRAVAQRLESLPNAIEVQGHTDDVAMHSSARYPSNWELAAARAANVVRLFVAAGMGPERFSAVSYGEYAPIASNETPEGRAQNRRIEIRLKPSEAAVEASGVGDEPAEGEMPGGVEAPGDGDAPGEIETPAEP